MCFFAKNLRRRREEEKKEEEIAIFFGESQATSCPMGWILSPWPHTTLVSPSLLAWTAPSSSSWLLAHPPPDSQNSPLPPPKTHWRQHWTPSTSCPSMECPARVCREDLPRCAKETTPWRIEDVITCQKCCRTMQQTAFLMIHAPKTTNICIRQGEQILVGR